MPWIQDHEFMQEGRAGSPMANYEHWCMFHHRFLRDRPIQTLLQQPQPKVKRANGSDVTPYVKLAGMDEKMVLGEHTHPGMEDTPLPHAGHPFFGSFLLPA